MFSELLEHPFQFRWCKTAHVHVGLTFYRVDIVALFNNLNNLPAAQNLVVASSKIQFISFSVRANYGTVEKQGTKIFQSEFSDAEFNIE